MKTLPEVLLEAAGRPLNWKAVQYKKNGQWQSLNWSEYFQKITALSNYLMASGVKRGDRVAILADTCVEWAISDLAILSIGAITVPVYPNGTPEEFAHILKDSGARTLIVGGAKQLQKWQDLKASVPSIEDCLIVEQDSWKNALATQGDDKAIRDCISKITIDDNASIVYTSGTSGLPKGVLLTHRQIMSEVTDIASVFKIDHNDMTLSFLPYAHVLGRVEMWLSVYVGYTVSFAESIDRIKNNLVEIAPTALIAVPRIFEKIYAGIESQLSQLPFVTRATDTLNRFSPTATSIIKGTLLSRKLKAAFGGRMRFAISGGAPLDREIGQFFRAAGLPIYEGYGLTESTASITVNTPEFHRFGTVGKPLPDVKIKIADDGEILVKSQKIMKGYYKKENAGADGPFIDGYFPTGDIGHLEDGYLVITDRKKDLIKTSGGKYVAPQKLENALKRNPIVSNVLVHGDQKKYIVALITLDESETKRWAKQNSIMFDDFRDLSQSQPVRESIAKLVASANSELASFESIKKFSVLDHDFTVASGELTPSLKVKRKYCDQKYRATIEALY